MEQNFKYIKILLNIKKTFKKDQIFFSYNNIVNYIISQEDNKNILNFLDLEAININSKYFLIIHKNFKSIKKNKLDNKLIFIEDYIKELQKNKDILNLQNLKENFPNEKFPLFYSEEYKNNDLLKDPENLIIEINVLIKTLKANSMSEDGSRVNYKKIKINSTNFQKLITLLPFINPFTLLKNEKMKKSFFINLYNILNVHTIVNYFKENPSKKTIPKFTRLNFFKKYYYNIGGFNFSLDDIEHGILRKNNNFGKRFFKTIWDYFCNNSFDDKSELRFLEEDPRNKFVLKKLDCRIHFALNCGAVSCPPIRAFNENDIDFQLDLASKNFLNQDLEIDLKNGVYFLKMSSILNWYRVDFGEEFGILKFIFRYLDKEGKNFKLVREVIENKQKYKLVYKDYDWTLNSGDN